MAFDWKSLIGSVAPTIATALGGPLAGVATQAISQAVLGKPNGKESEIQTVLATASPDTLLKLKEAENAFAIKLTELEIDLEKVNAADRSNARDREIKTGDSWTPRILAAVVVLGWFSIQWFLLKHIVPQEMREIILRTMGTLDMALGLVLGYYFGSSSSSSQKNELLAKK